MHVNPYNISKGWHESLSWILCSRDIVKLQVKIKKFNAEDDRFE